MARGSSLRSPSELFGTALAYQCDRMGITFRHTWSLLVHMRHHTVQFVVRRPSVVGLILVLIATALACPSPTAHGASVTVTIENTSPVGGFFLTPFWVGFHNGGFDSYDGGQLASLFPGLTDLAEEGNTGPISTAFGASAAGVAGGVDFTLVAPTAAPTSGRFSPGTSSTQTYDIGDATVNRYFSYAAMVIPSNDLFVANGNPTLHELFDGAGNPQAPITISIFGSAVNDNGTEVNNALGGALFSANGGVSVAESPAQVIRNFFTDEPADSNYLADFVGTQTTDGSNITSAFAAGTQLVSITVTPVPEPSTLGLLVFAGAGLAWRPARRWCRSSRD